MHSWTDVASGAVTAIFRDAEQGLPVRIDAP
jgi:hypothetical protein